MAVNTNKRDNNINELQNTEEILIYLTAQRKLYSCSKNILRIKFFISTFVAIIGLNKAINNNTYFKVISTLWIIIFFILENKQKKKRKTAADMQEVVDRKLYELDMDIPGLDEHGLYKEALKIEKDNIEYFKEQMSTDGHNGGVVNWYSDVSKLSKENAIIFCQIENINWDSDLRRRFYKFNKSLLFIIILIYIGYYRNETIKSIFFSMYPILSILIDRIGYIFNDYNSLNSGKELIGYLNKLYMNIGKNGGYKTKDKILSIQHCIYERRYTVLPIPDWFYNIYRSEDQIYYNELVLKLKEKIVSNNK